MFLRQKVQNADGTFIIPTSGPVPSGNELHIDGYHYISLIKSSSVNCTSDSIIKDKLQVICYAFITYFTDIRSLYVYTRTPRNFC